MKESQHLKEVYLSIIAAIDQYNYLLKDHHKHVTYLAYLLANTYGLSRQKTANLIYTAAIHDIGAITVEERDDLLSHDVKNPEAHEKLGAEMIGDVRFLKASKAVIRHHHVRFDDQLEVPFECYFLHLADRMDVLYEANKTASHEAMIEAMKTYVMDEMGQIFHPDLEAAFLKVLDSEGVFEEMEEASLYDLLINYYQEMVVTLDYRDMENLAELFARIVDLKSHWTRNHSKTVSVLAFKIARLMDLDMDTCFKLKLAGLLHDVGKIGVPSEIINKPGSLTAKEFQIMKRHATYSGLIFSEIQELGDIRQWVAMHHEKRDHTGYPLKLDSHAFTIEVDILEYADILSALLENRPYRKRLDREEIIRTLECFAKDQLDSGVCQVILAHLDPLIDLFDQTKRSLVDTE